MSLFQWRNHYDTHIHAVDSHHHLFVALLNDLDAALSAGANPIHLEGVLTRIREHALAHFQLEEGLMREHGFPGLEDHMREHARLVDRVERFDLHKARTSPDEARDMLLFLHDWLIDHVTGTDKACCDFLRERGVK